MAHSPRIAKATDPVGTTTAGRSSGEGTSQRRYAADPEAVLALVREHVREGRILLAREASAEGAVRFPGHAELRNAARILSGGEAVPHPGTEASTDEEFEWLQNPPAWAHGKWVALVGREAVAAADTLAEVMASIRSMDLPRKPLVHRIA